MRGTIMISLVGEQPIPNLLPILYVKPRHAVLVCTERTKKVSERLSLVLKSDPLLVSVEEPPIVVEPYDMIKIENALKRVISDRSWCAKEVVFNLTGGTKPMALAAYRLAEQFRSPFLYVQGEGRKSMVYHYRFSERGLEIEKMDEVPPVLNIDVYLKAHLGDYKEDEPRDEFEQMVYMVLRPELDEVKTSIKPPSEFGSLEIDLVLRCGNHVGIAEVKTGGKAKEKRGIEQIITAAEQRFLGTYTKKFLVLDREYGSNNLRLAKAHGIIVIELLSAQTGKLSLEDRNKLIQAVKAELGG